MNFVKGTLRVSQAPRNGRRYRRSRDLYRQGHGGLISWQLWKPIAVYVGLVSVLSVGSLGAL